MMTALMQHKVGASKNISGHDSVDSAGAASLCLVGAVGVRTTVVDVVLARRLV
jgi:hypothetical protein